MLNKSLHDKYKFILLQKKWEWSGVNWNGKRKGGKGKEERKNNKQTAFEKHKNCTQNDIYKFVGITK